MDENFTPGVFQQSSPPDNPFLDPIASYLNTENLSERLVSWPLAQVDVRELSLQDRYALLDKLQVEMFEPTSTSLNITVRTYRLIGRSLQTRNPTLPAIRRKTMAIARCIGTELTQLPWFATYAMGMLLSGITGCGKTYEVIRALKLIPQRIEHPRSEAAGWTHMVQAPWLYIGMSFDGSLGGLLLQILVALDEAIWSDYSQDKSLLRLSNEKLAVHVGLILRNHGVGLLVIDEIQSRNFSDDARGTLAATFFLRMLNFGIPILLMGNPLGINALNSFSQDLRRLGAGGSIKMHPHERSDYDWKECLAPAIWRYSVMPEASPFNDKDGSILYKYSGGIRDYACRIRAASQRLALDADPAAKFVTEAHMAAAFFGTDFSNLERSLISGFRDKNHLILRQFVDVPWEEYGVRWGKIESPESANEADSNGGTTQDTNINEDCMNGATGADEESKKVKPQLQKAKENILRSRTRKANEATQTDKFRKTLDPSDMRNAGLQEHLVTGIEANRVSQKVASKKVKNN
jgi:hypothetical protein